MVTYPLHVYFMEDGSPAKCYTDTINYWQSRGINIQVFTPDFNDFTNDELYPCKICKNGRKYYVDPFIEKYSKSMGGATRIGIVTGYTLYDALAYMDEILLVSNFQYTNVTKADNVKIQNRVKNCLHKMKAKEELPNGLVIIRPLINMHENKVVEYLLEEGIPYINRPCVVAKDKHKREILKRLMWQPQLITLIMTVYLTS
ncbi:MAG: hypothetical protein LBI78_06990 [Campylobacteraceae bacterium]|jgi:tRNA(Ile)-lysidine synthase TilS/MesJ|nr:hypothetical protein [Campylobacteraceae bacterium]